MIEGEGSTRQLRGKLSLLGQMERKIRLEKKGTDLSRNACQGSPARYAFASFSNGVNIPCRCTMGTG